MLELGGAVRDKGWGSHLLPLAMRGPKLMLAKVTLILSAWAWSAHQARGHLPSP